jgi:hypothetical protein
MTGAFTAGRADFFVFVSVVAMLLSFPVGPNPMNSATFVLHASVRFFPDVAATISSRRRRAGFRE